MRDPCPYCGLPGKTTSWLDPWTKEIVRRTEDHPCSAFDPVPQPAYAAIPVTFISEARNRPEALEEWRRALRPKGTDRFVSCGICDERVGIGYDEWSAHVQVCKPD